MFGVCFQALLSIEFNFHYWYYLKFELVNSKPGESYKERCCDSRPLSAWRCQCTDNYCSLTLPLGTALLSFVLVHQILAFLRKMDCDHSFLPLNTLQPALFPGSPHYFFLPVKSNDCSPRVCVCLSYWTVKYVCFNGFCIWAIDVAGTILAGGNDLPVFALLRSCWASCGSVKW